MVWWVGCEVGGMWGVCGVGCGVDGVSVVWWGGVWDGWGECGVVWWGGVWMG